MTNPIKSKTSVNVGIDVGKWFLDVCLYEKDLHWQVENTPEGVRKLLARLGRYQVERLVMEATGRLLCVVGTNSEPRCLDTQEIQAKALIETVPN